MHSMRLLTTILLPLILTAAPKTVSTIAGTGVAGFSGDGDPAVQANEPYEARFDKAGNMFFVEMQNHVVRRVPFSGFRVYDFMQLRQG
jgi:hypothetical protein